MKHKILLLGLAFSFGLNAQQNPTGAGNTTVTPNVANSSFSWFRGGNLNGGAAGNNNIFGTLWNSPIYTRTASVTRMQLTGNLPAVPYLGATIDLTGHLGIGLNGFFDVNTPLTMLHLQGPNNTLFNGGSYRTWMRTGMFANENSDAMYVGMKPEAGTNRSDAVIYWSDDANVDKLRFLMGTTLTSLPGAINPLTGGSANGYEFMRMQTVPGINNHVGFPVGHVGIGPLFTDPLPPQSRLHINAESALPTFMQITNVDNPVTNILGTGQTATDGLRFGIQNVSAPAGNRQFGLLQWQENTPFVVQTEWDNTAGTLGERLRVTSVGALINTEGTSYLGIPAPTNTTRMGVSHLGNNPLSRPMSLMHLGYNLGSSFGGLPIYFGWRDWMDLGMMVSNNTDNMWIGLKPRTGGVTNSNDRMDAVINWGNNAPGTPNNADVMRFIFTAEPTSFPTVENQVAKSNDGLEMMRLYPETQYAHYLYDTNGNVIDSVMSYGRVGVGDFTVQGVNQQPTQKLDVVGNGRFRYLPDSTYIADTSVTKYVMVDEDGVLRWTAAGAGFGTICADTVGGKLHYDTKVDLNNYNLYFTRNDTLNTNQVAIGYDCGTPLDSKFNVYSKNERWAGGFYVDGNSPIDSIGNNHQGGVKSIIDSTKTLNATAIYGYVAPNLYTTMVSQIGVKGEVLGKSVKEAVGVYGISTVTAPNNGAIGGRFLSNGSSVGRAVQAQNFTMQSNATPGSGFGFGGDFNCNTASGQSVNSNVGVVGSANGLAQNNTGVRGLASGNGVINMGVFGQATGGGQNWAGYFQGNVYISGSYGPSDENLKENVTDIENADSLLSLLNPVTFDFKTTEYPQLQLQDGNQMGLIAQQVEPIFPSMVKENSSPAQYDSLGNIVVPSVNFKTVDYTKLIPLLISGHQDQANEIEAKDSIIEALSAQNVSQQETIDDLNARLTNLENCLSSLLPTLCSMNQSLVQNNTPTQQEEVRRNLNVVLSSRSAIILDQNVPNPFAEQTVINYSIPATVVKAQIHFYDGMGKLIHSVDVTERGLGSLTVFGSDLSTGVYTYTLVADGQIVATKKMMKQ